MEGVRGESQRSKAKEGGGALASQASAATAKVVPFLRIADMLQ
jgi:hypothetical protein